MGCGNSKATEGAVQPLPSSKSDVVVELPVKAPPAKAAPTKPAPVKPAPAKSATGTPETLPSVNLALTAGIAPGSYIFTPRPAPTPRFIPFQANPTEYGSKVFLGQVANQV